MTQGTGCMGGLMGVTEIVKGWYVLSCASVSQVILAYTFHSVHKKLMLEMALCVPLIKQTGCWDMQWVP